ncbi:MAG: 6-hydroxycyclohex-1-ene-1-carbonyl-CoA dehydrogenase [Proteobacteria bacterium]|nr:6-hydroxycyclohex-1-ene-1-carbonyl-CoA dehydrogenase [Pseudomonadota bacterium]
MDVVRWMMTAPGAPLVRDVGPAPSLEDGQVLVEIAGCGVCHTDVGFWAEGVPTRGELPLTLGHEISGFVVGAGGSAGSEALMGRAVVVPAVLPCGRCAACEADQSGVCRNQFMPGNDGHGGFASHVVVPADGLCEVPQCTSATQPLGTSGVTLRQLSVLADAASTAWQAVLRSGLRDGELVVVVGCGGVGSFAIQLARACGAQVIAIDTDPRRRDAALHLGAARVIDGADAKTARKEVKAAAKGLGAPAFGARIFECSGHPAGQELAFQLVGPAGVLMVIGYTADRVPVHLSRLMAMDARAIGTWGCSPKYYAGLLDMVLDGVVTVASLVEEHPLDDVQSVLESVHRHELARRAVLVPSESS